MYSGFGSLTGTPGSEEDEHDGSDFYEIDIVDGTPIRVTMKPHNQADYDIYLYDSNGDSFYESRAASVDGGDTHSSDDGKVESIQFTADNSGKWRIEVDRVGNSDGLYLIIVDTGELDYDHDDVDWQNSGPDGQGDTYAELYSVNDGDYDNDGWIDEKDNCPGTSNRQQYDMDNDGTGDACDPDIDGDNHANDADNCPAITNDQADMDLDGRGDVCDPDIDGDGINNGPDNCDYVQNPGQADLDQDGIGNACDPDIDGDGINNGPDNCDYNYNPGQADLDADGLGDVCDPDIDGDGLNNESDNCVYASNPGQLDEDEDGMGDACDPDIDNDGFENEDDNCPRHSNPEQEDLDGDGTGDACTADAATDVDGDGRGVTDDNCPVHANPEQLDSDGDGIGDQCETDDQRKALEDDVEQLQNEATSTAGGAAGTVVSIVLGAADTAENAANNAVNFVSETKDDAVEQIEDEIIPLLLSAPGTVTAAVNNAKDMVMDEIPNDPVQVVFDLAVWVICVKVIDPSECHTDDPGGPLVDQTIATIESEVNDAKDWVLGLVPDDIPNPKDARDEILAIVDDIRGGINANPNGGPGIGTGGIFNPNACTVPGNDDLEGPDLNAWLYQNWTLGYSNGTFQATFTNASWAPDAGCDESQILPCDNEIHEAAATDAEAKARDNWTITYSNGTFHGNLTNDFAAHALNCLNELGVSGWGAPVGDESEDEANRRKE